jgi:hypothetical protein
MIKLGQNVKIKQPDGFEDGIVKYIHPTNRWFSVEHGTEDYKWRTSFMFDDIGKTVRIVKG